MYLKEGDLDSEGSVWDVEEHLSDISDILNERYVSLYTDISCFFLVHLLQTGLFVLFACIFKFSYDQFYCYCYILLM